MNYLQKILSNYVKYCVIIAWQCQEDFWHSLENQWKDAGLVDEQEESWVKDFEELHANNFVAKDYSFQKNNPLKEATDCLKAGKEKLDEGRLAGFFVPKQVIGIIQCIKIVPNLELGKFGSEIGAISGSAEV